MLSDVLGNVYIQITSRANYGSSVFLHLARLALVLGM